MTAVIFVEPESPGNIGSLARAMKNFGLTELYLAGGAEPDDETRMMAMHAFDVVEKSGRITLEEARLKFSQLVATTAQVGSDYNVNRSWITPDDITLSENSAIVLGRESKGLTNEEIALCDVVVTIPTHKGYPTLNVTHAAAILFYELFKRESSLKVADPALIRRIEKIYGELLPLVDIPEEKRATHEAIFHRILGRSVPTAREASGLIGVLKRAKQAILRLSR